MLIITQSRIKKDLVCEGAHWFKTAGDFGWKELSISRFIHKTYKSNLGKY